MSGRSLVEVLGESRFAAGLSPESLAAFAGLSRLKSFPPGTVLFQGGTENHNLFLVAEGDVALDMHVPGRGAVRILSVGPGEMLGWSALVGDGRMTATATTLNDVTALVCAGPALRSLCDHDHVLGYQVMRQMAIALSRRLLATRLQLLDLFAESASHAPSVSGAAPSSSGAGDRMNSVRSQSVDSPGPGAEDNATP